MKFHKNSRKQKIVMAFFLNNNALFFCTLFFLLSQFTFLTAFFTTSRDQHVGLIQLRSSLGLRRKEWGIKSDPCLKWVGIQCFNGSVTEINISGFKRTRIGKQNPQFSVKTLMNFTQLSVFNASGFDLPGEIPDWFGEQLGSIQVLDLRKCSIFGQIPENLGSLRNLAGLYLSGNRLTGVIPASLGQIKSLSILDLAENSLTGSIPISFGSLLNLTFLDLSSNLITGSIPVEIQGLCNLRKLNLSNNNLTSLIPAQLGDLSNLIDLDLSLNSLTGQIPNALWNMPQLGFIDVSYNYFSGSLPNPISNPSRISVAAVFNLSHNLLYGNLTYVVTRFDFVDLSSNYLQGHILDQLTTTLSLDTNCFKNSSNQRTSKDCFSFYDTLGLKFDNYGILTPLPPHQSTKRKNAKKCVYLVSGIFTAFFLIVLFLALLVSFVLWCGKHNRTIQRSTNVVTVSTDAASPSLTPDALPDYLSFGNIFTHQQILDATCNFCDENLIRRGHSGDFFRGLLGGIPTIIKRIDLTLVKIENYLTEVELFSKVAHQRLVPFLGHCGEIEDQKFLVYKYMPYGDLSNSLFWKNHYADEGQDQLQSLDWITRLKIATGAAEGLSYLHHECNPPLVHRDVQASSILLDDKFEVRLGSLSEICTQDNDLHQSLISRLMRIPQSSEQGASGTHTAMCAYDVYCFGKVLLELVTGKLGGSNEWMEDTLKFISPYDKEPVIHIVDPTLIIDDDLLEEVWAMAVVARSCLNPKPLRRPMMKYVVKALENPVRVVRPDIIGSTRLGATYSSNWRHNATGVDDDF